VSAATSPVSLLSVIIVNWNGAPFLPRCLQSLREQTLLNIHVMVVDNRSSDESVTLTRRDYPEVDVLELDDNYGYAAANNKAAALSQARYLLFLNNDTYLDREALSALVGAAEAQPGVAIFAPQQRGYDSADAWHTGLGLDVLGYPCTGKTFYADGAALFIRRNVFDALGGFDTHYFMFYEEADLCWRAWLWGYRVGPVPNAIIYHKGGGTAGSSVASKRQQFVTTRSKRRLAHRNQLVTILKNYSALSLCAVLPVFALFTSAEISLLIATGQGSAVKASYLPAWRDLWHDRHHIAAMRRRIQTSRAVSDWAILRRMEWTPGAMRVLLRSGAPKIA
jgi:GT2 family glycosyltransferase